MPAKDIELTAAMVVDAAIPVRPAISPDGRRVAYAVVTSGGPGGQPHLALWTADSAAEAPPRRLTDGTAGDTLPCWAPDSASVYFVSDRSRPGVRQAYRVAADGGEPEALTGFTGGVAGVLPLTDGRTLALLAEGEPTGTRSAAADGPTAEGAAAARDEPAADQDDDAIVVGESEPYDRLWLLDLDSGTARAVDGLGRRHVIEVAQRPDGGPLAVLSWECAAIDPGARTGAWHLVDPSTGAVRALGPAGPEASSPVWWRVDGVWHLAHLATTPATDGGSPLGGLAVIDTAVDPATGAGGAVPGAPGGPRNLTAGLPSCPVELVQVADGPPLALFAEGLDTALHRLDPGTSRFRRLCTGPARITSLTASRSGTTVAALVATAYAPDDVHAGPTGGDLVRLSDTRPEFRAVRWGTLERLAYTAADGLALDGVLLLPPGRTRADGPFPLVTVVHGGPYDRYTEAPYIGPMFSGQWFAAAGHAVFLPNPRGSSGRGHAFAAMVAGQLGGAELTDVLSGIDLLVAEGVADPDRLGIAGWSHGGYLATWAVARTDRFRAAMTGAGISDWGMLVGTGEAGAQEADLSGSTGWEGPGPHPHDRVSPISYASRIRTPLLIVHGEQDTNVPVGQSVFLHRALRHHGAEHTFVVYPREGHWIGERAHQLDLLRRSRAWFARRLG